jgi:hypothetical protein
MAGAMQYLLAFSDIVETYLPDSVRQITSHPITLLSFLVPQMHSLPAVVAVHQPALRVSQYARDEPPPLSNCIEEIGSFVCRGSLPPATRINPQPQAVA